MNNYASIWSAKKLVEFMEERKIQSFRMDNTWLSVTYAGEREHRFDLAGKAFESVHREVVQFFGGVIFASDIFLLRAVDPICRKIIAERKK